MIEIWISHIVCSAGQKPFGNVQHAHDIDKIEKHLQNLLEINPASVHAIAQMGLVKLTQGKHNEAEKLFSHALALESNYPIALYGQSKVFELRRETEAARMLLKRITENIANARDFHRRYMALAFCSLGRSAESDNYVIEALKCYDCALDLCPDMGLGHMRKGLLEAVVHSGKAEIGFSVKTSSLQKTLSHLYKAEQAGFISVETLYYKGLMEFLLHEWNSAISTWAELNDSDLTFAQSQFLIPKVAYAHFMLGMEELMNLTDESSDLMREARSKLERAVALQPRVPQYLFGAAMARLVMRDHEGADKFFTALSDPAARDMSSNVRRQGLFFGAINDLMINEDSKRERAVDKLQTFLSEERDTVEKRARELEIAVNGATKTYLIHEIQNAEGTEQCFGMKSVCRHQFCIWRDDCFNEPQKTDLRCAFAQLIISYYNARWADFAETFKWILGQANQQNGELGLPFDHTDFQLSNVLAYARLGNLDKAVELIRPLLKVGLKDDRVSLNYVKLLCSRAARYAEDNHIDQACRELDDADSFLENHLLPDLTISQDGSGNYQTISKALEAAKQGDTLLVRSGVYRESISLKAGVKVIGENKETTRIEYDGDSSTIVAHSIDNTCLKNLTIAYTGKAKCRPLSLVSAHVSIENCIIAGGVLSGIDASGGSLTVRQSTIQGNKRNGIRIHHGAKGTFTENMIHQNGICGIEVGIGTESVMEGNIISGNNRSGIHILGRCQTRIAENLIYNNSAHGCEIESMAKPDIQNNTFYGNEKAGILAHSHSSPTIISNIIAENDWGIAIGEVGSRFGEIKLSCTHNCVWNNQTADYVSIQKPDTDISVDPLFVSAQNSDFRLHPNSPCFSSSGDGSMIGAGANRGNCESRR